MTSPNDALQLVLAELLDDSLDAEDMERLSRARKHAAEVLADVEAAPDKGPLRRDLNDNESILAWAVDYLTDVIVGVKGVNRALQPSAPASARGAEPVAWKFRMDGVDQVMLDEDADIHVRRNGTPLYAAPLPAATAPCDHPAEFRQRGPQNDWCGKCGFFPLPSATATSDQNWIDLGKDLGEILSRECAEGEDAGECLARIINERNALRSEQPATASSERSFNDLLGDVQGRLLKMGLEPGRWPDPTIRDTGDYEEAAQCLTQWCADRLRSETPASETAKPTSEQQQRGVEAYQQWRANSDNRESSAYGGNLHDLARRMYESMR